MLKVEGCQMATRPGWGSGGAGQLSASTWSDYVLVFAIILLKNPAGFHKKPPGKASQLSAHARYGGSCHAMFLRKSDSQQNHWNGSQMTC